MIRLAPWVEGKVRASNALSCLGMSRRAHELMIAGMRASVLLQLELAKTSLMDHFEVVRSQHPSVEDVTAILDTLDTVMAAIQACSESAIMDALTRDSTCPPPAFEAAE